MVLVFYNLALLAALVAGVPWWLWRMATTRKYREGLSQRLGRVPPSIRTAASAAPVLWLHAVSVGEVLAVTRLVRELRETFPGHQVLVSTTTRTGHALARRHFGADRVFYCPLDLPFAVRAWLGAISPSMLILAETEFWPNLLTACFRRGIPVAVVNARISDRSWPRYQMLRRLWQPILGRIALVFAQSQRDADRLVDIGCTAAAVSVSGNLKFDVRAPGQSEAARILRSIAPAARFLIAGSTLEGEESALLAAWPALLRERPDLVLVLAPRHPERFSAVESLLRASSIPFVLRSAWPADSMPPPLAAGSVVLLDTIGELAGLYSVASVAFVGGSLIPAGGHNPLEPAQFAVPVVMGPYYANFRAIVDDLRAQDAIRIAPPGELAAALLSLLADPSLASGLGERGRQVFLAQSGATARTLDGLRTLLSGLPASPQPSVQSPSHSREQSA